MVAAMPKLYTRRWDTSHSRRRARSLRSSDTAGMADMQARQSYTLTVTTLVQLERGRVLGPHRLELRHRGLVEREQREDHAD